MADTTHPSILQCQMKGGPTGINIDSIYSVVPDLNKPKTHTVVYLEGMDDGLVVEGTSVEIIAQWSEQLFFRSALEDGYLDAEEGDTSGE